jgi:hypothetical protein
MASRSTADLEVGLALHARGGDADRAGDFAHDAFQVKGLALEGVEVVAEDFDADLRADAGGEHENAVFDGLQKTGHVAGHDGELALSSLTSFSLVMPARHSRFGLEHDRGLDHLHRRGIGGGIGAAEFAADAGDFGRLAR